MSLYRLPLSSPYGRSNYDASNNLSGSNCGLLLSNRNSQLNDVSKEGDSRKVTTANENEVHRDFRRGDAMAKLLISGLMADCTFIVGPENETAEVIPGHKVFFILVSEVFEEMFTGNFKEAGKNSEIRITDVEPRDFKNFRYIIYRNDCTLFDTLLIEDIIQIYMLSDKYLAHSIKKSCVDYLKRLLPKMSVENLILMFQFTRSLEEQILLDQVKNRIRTVDVKNNPKLMDLSYDEFYEIILVLREQKLTLDMFSIIEFYFKNMNLESEEKKETPKEVDSLDQSSAHKTLGKCLRCLEFAYITPNDFKKGPGKSNILTYEQKYYILSRLGEEKSVVLK